MFSFFLSVLKGVIYYDIDYSKIRSKHFLSTLSYLISLFELRFPKRPILLIFKLLKDTLLFRKKDGKENNLGLKTLIIEELNLLGVVQTTLPIINEYKPLRFYVYEVGYTILTLEKSNFPKLIKTAGLSSIFLGSSKKYREEEEEFHSVVGN